MLLLQPLVKPHSYFSILPLPLHLLNVELDTALSIIFDFETDTQKSGLTFQVCFMSLPPPQLLNYAFLYCQVYLWAPGSFPGSIESVMHIYSLWIPMSIYLVLISISVAC